MEKRHIAAGALGALLIGGGLWWLLRSPVDPRQMALGEWREATSRLRVEVEPEKAAWRGMGHGVVRYEWLEAEKEPYRVRFTYRGEAIEAKIAFDGKNTAILEPDVWHKLSSLAQEQLRELNRRHNRPETEFRLVFRREAGEKRE